MSKRKRAVRERQVAEEILHATVEKNEEARISELPSDQIFVIDTLGSRRRRERIKKELQTSGDLKKISAVEEKLIRKAVESIKGTSRNTLTAPTDDIWDDDNQPKPKTRMRKPGPEKAKRKVPVHPGLSYHPQQEDHQEVLGEALALEVSRIEDEERVSSLLTGEFSDLTKSIMKDDDNWVEEEDGGDDTSQVIPRKRRKEAKTTAQKNKKRRLKLKNFEVGLQMKQKMINEQIQRVDAVVMSLDKEAAVKAQRKELRELRRAKKDDGPPPLTRVTASSVPLTDDLGGSQRAVKHGGGAATLLQEHVQALRTSNFMPITKRKDSKNRPHGKSWVKTVDVHK